jgi:Zn-dependent M28 family amino/carboxypeptidase
MESARLLSVAGAKPKRSILFVLFAGEEFGLLGATAWVKAHEKELDKISNLFNRDGGPTVANGVTVSQAMYEDFIKISEGIDQINPAFGFKVNTFQPRPRPTVPGGTDASVFAIRGVPTIAFDNSDRKDIISITGNLA